MAGKTFFGMLLGALLGGWMADRWGRRFVGIFLALLGGLAGMACMGAKTPESLGLWRMTAGISYGGLGPVLFAYLCDFTRRANRGRILVFLEMCWAFGSLGMAFWAVGVLSFWGWRGVLAFPVLLGLVALPLWFGPESPRYLFARGNREALQKRYGQVPAVMEALPSHPWTDLFRKEFLRRTLVLLFAWGVVSFGYYALFLWLPKIFASSGIGVVKARWFTLFVMAIQVPGYLLAAWLVERWGRVRSLAFFFVGTGGASLFFMGVTSSGGFLAAALAVGLFCLGAWGGGLRLHSGTLPHISSGERFGACGGFRPSGGYGGSGYHRMDARWLRGRYGGARPGLRALSCRCGGGLPLGRGDPPAFHRVVLGSYLFFVKTWRSHDKKSVAPRLLSMF